MTATSTATIPTPIGGNIAGQYSDDAVSTRAIDEAQYHTAPMQLFPSTPKEEMFSIREQDCFQSPNGEICCFKRNAEAFSMPGYTEVFQAKMQKSVKDMIANAQANNQFKPTISLQTVDYNDFGLKSKKELFTVDAPTLQAFKSSQALRDAGITVLGMPSTATRFEMVAYDQTGRAITGNEWNTFMDNYADIVAQEQQQKTA